MLTIRDHQSGDLFDPWEHLGPKRRSLLEKSWAGVFRQYLLEHLPVAELTASFCASFGRPTKDLYAVLGALILQQLHDLTDVEAVEAIALHRGWQYALDIRCESDAYICERTLRNYRRRVMAQGLQETLFRGLTDQLIKAFGIDTRRQRIDSTSIRSDMRALTRLGIVVETISKFLRELARKHPDLNECVDEETLRLYVKRTGDGCFALSKPSESKRRLPEAAKKMYELVELFRQTPAAEMNSYHLLIRVLQEQCEVVFNEAKQAQIDVKEPIDIPCDSVQNPADPDSSYNTYHGHGYKAQIIETYREDRTTVSGNIGPPPNLISHVAINDMTKQDWQALEPAFEDLADREILPDHLLGDTHYGSEGNIQKAHEKRVDLITPTFPARGHKQGRLTLEQFELDEEGSIVRCPQGHAPISTSMAPKKHRANFDPDVCSRCEQWSQCPAYSTTRKMVKSRWQYTHERVRTRNRRLHEQTKHFRDRYRWRAGIEGTMSQLKRQMQLARLRIRGMAGVAYAVFLRALGLNIRRVEAFIQAN
jgi:hypothetical protein